MNLVPLSWKKIQAIFQIFILHAINSCFSFKIYPSRLYFTVSSVYSYLFIVSGCPAPCTCGIRSIDCSMSELTVLPNLEDFTSVSFINFSFNDFKSLKENDTYIPPLTVLDFSFSHISFIPDNFFKSEHFLRLEILNLSGNPLGEVNFALPVSVKVLKLSKNSLQDLSVSRLYELVDLQTLHVEHNKLKFLHTDREKTSSFNDMTKDRVNIEKKSDPNNDCLFEPFKHIVEVSYRGNHIQMLQLSALNCFKNVAYLSLADNRLESIPKKAFDAFNRLQFLDLSGNQLKSLPVDIFKKISSLKFLSLSNNKLRNVPANLPMMEWLDLSFNNIVSVAEEQKSDLYPQEVFLLGGNPLHCDCQLLWVKELYDTREYLLNYIEVDKNNFIPICTSPEHLKGDTWDVLGDESFGCSASEDLMKSALNSVDEGLLIHLEDLSINVVEVGSSHVILEWDSLRLATTAETHQDPGKLDKMLITCHQFGKKSAQSAFAVPVDLGHYTLKALNPNTAYVICMSLTNPTSKTEHFNKVYHENCVEIITQGSYFMHIFNGVMEQYIIIISVLFIIFWVVIRFCSPKHEIRRGKVD